MKKTTKIINEGFTKKYMKEDYLDTLEKDIKRVLKQYGYNTSVDGADNYISAAAEYIEMARDFEPDEDYSVEDWLHDTELNYPEELEFMKSMNESTELNLGPLSFKSDLGTKVIDNADKISKTVSTLSPLLADDASEKEEIKYKEVFHNDNGQDYDVIERSSSGKNALLKRGNKWIVAWNCPKDSGSWGQGHYFFDEESARKVWKDKYLNESLKKINFNNDPGFLDDLEASYKNAVEAGLEGSELEKELINGFLKNERYKGFYFPASIKSKVKEFIRNKKTNESLKESYYKPVDEETELEWQSADLDYDCEQSGVYSFASAKQASIALKLANQHGWRDAWRETQKVYLGGEKINESLKENDYYRFQSDVYNALSDVMFKWRDRGIDESDMSKALTWFDIHFWEDEEY